MAYSQRMSRHRFILQQTEWIAESLRGFVMIFAAGTAIAISTSRKSLEAAACLPVPALARTFRRIAMNCSRAWQVLAAFLDLFTRQLRISIVTTLTASLNSEVDADIVRRVALFLAQCRVVPLNNLSIRARR